MCSDVATQFQSHRCSIEGAEKPVSGVDPACESHYIIGYSDYATTFSTLNPFLWPALSVS